MEIPSYTSNIQPNGSQSGIKIASENDSAKRVSSEQQARIATEARDQRQRSMELRLSNRENAKS